MFLVTGVTATVQPKRKATNKSHISSAEVLVTALRRALANKNETKPKCSA